MSAPLSPIEQIKETLKIEDLIGETFTLTGRGRTRSTTEHDSLKIFTDTNTWYWYSRDTGGDLFDWWQYNHRCDFRSALEELAQRAKVELRPLTPAERQHIDAQRSEQRNRQAILHIAADYYHCQLLAHPAALAYCHQRGWTDETIQREHLGYSPGPADKPLLSLGKLSG